MASKVIRPSKDKLQSKIQRAEPPNADGLLTISFSKFKLEPVTVNKEFNNHFKDAKHFNEITASLLGVILPKITSHPYKDLSEGGTDGRSIHFHIIDSSHLEIVRKILREYHYTDSAIDQIFEGGKILQFSANLGHNYPARLVCQQIDDLLLPLFLDVNHHIYMNEKYIKESIFYVDCPVYQQEQCHYMPQECYAAGYLDETKLRETFGFEYAP